MSPETSRPPTLFCPARLLSNPPLLDTVLATSVRVQTQSVQERAFCFSNLRRLYELEAQIFPDEPRLLQSSINPLNREQVDLEIEAFFMRVSLERFPVSEGGWNDWDDYPALSLNYIYVLPQGVNYDGYHYEHEGAFDERGITDVLMCLAYPDLLSGRCNGDPYDPTPYTLLEQTYPTLKPPATTLSLLRLLPTLEQMALPPPLDGLPDLIRIITASTDLFWLDYCYEEYAESFTPEFWDNHSAVSFLTEEWALAQPLIERWTTLMRWADVTDEAQAERNWQTVLDTLARAHIIQTGQLELPIFRMGE